MFTNLQMAVDANNPAIVDLRVEQNKLTTSYTKLISSITIDFNGERLPLSGIRKYFTSNDRSLRKAAYMAFGQALEDNKQQLDEIYDKLVKVRTQMGRKAGLKAFRPLATCKCSATATQRKTLPSSVATF